MNKKILWSSSLILLSLWISACGGKTAPATNTSKPANSNSAAAAKKEPPKPQAELKNEAKPADMKTKDVPNKVPTPKDWIYYSDEVKGYGFYLPEGSKGDSSSASGVDTFTAETPSGIGVIIFAWKDKTETKESLLNEAVRIMKEDWQETVTAGKLQGESDDYAVAEAASVDAAGKKYKMKILVGTDITDNYVMFVYTDDSKFEANKSIIDEIWGGFEMYSGGAGGKN
ncbi:MAG: hypothetical protein HY231_26000 [Acidobacteria bacterium]|nr:hypothetical protein [Acidobacteriota bacterium]